MINVKINLKTINNESLIGEGNIDIPQPDLSPYATKTYVDDEINNIVIPTKTSDLTNDSGFITTSALAGFATESWVEAKNYLTVYNLTGYATEDWVIARNYLTASSLTGYATENYVDNAISVLDIPTKTSDLTNDSGFITTSALSNYTTKTYVDGEIDSVEGQILSVSNDLTDLDNELATVAKSGDYNDLSNRPTIPSEQVNSDWNAVSGKAQILNKPTLFDGDYNSLSNRPTIPTKTSDLTNDSGFVDSSALTGLATEQYVDDAIDALVIPTKTSDLTNDSGFIDSTALSPYSTTTQMNTAISNKVEKVNVSTVTANKTLNITNDYGRFLYITTSTTLTIPTNASQAFEIGTRIDGYSTVASLTVTASSGVTLSSDENKTKVATNTGFSLIKVATDTWVLVGKLIS